VTNPLLEVHRFGQSLWYDDLSRPLLEEGHLRRMVERDGLRGVTSNPSIFQRALSGSDAYDAELARAVEEGADALAAYERLAVQDVRAAADLLRPVYDATGGGDGFVSLEVSPHLAHDSEGTVHEARRLRAAVDRTNLMIKVPATPAGLPAIETLVGEGVPVNVTLLFSVEVYARVAEAFLRGAERWVGGDGDPRRVASVASFFVSRVDGLVDEALDARIAGASDPARRGALQALRGKAAIANARLAYAHFRETLARPRWRALAARGVRPQRVLWASTSTKDPAYPRTKYVDGLVAADTVNTLPGATWEAYREEGRPTLALGEACGHWPEDLAGARRVVAELAREGIDLAEVTATLLDQGVQLFADAFDGLLAALEDRRRALLGARLARQSERLGPAEEEVAALREQWRREGGLRRLWSRDAALWTGGDEARWLDWLDAPARTDAEALSRLAARASQGHFRHVLLLGMGGSSLCPDVLARTFGRRERAPELRVLDSTVPGQVARTGAEIDAGATLFVVSSKSGTTIEPTCFLHHFAERARESLGGDARAAADRFVAITDPGSALEEQARREGFRAVAHGVPGIGGRFSALSPFGLLPAALMGLDVAALRDNAARMAGSCGPAVPPAENPGARLGLALGSLARRGRDKLTLVLSPRIASLGGWLEQLVAESLGKQGVGVVPVDGEVPAGPEAYGEDRLFVQMVLRGDASDEQDAALEKLAAAGHPVVRIELSDPEQLAQEFFRWEVATAVAGAVLGVNPFDQPDVEAAKVEARELMAAYRESGELPAETPLAADGELLLYGDPALQDAGDLAGALRAHLERARPGDYFAVNAFLDMRPEMEEPLQQLRHAVRDRLQLATTLGFGPRFLHSTGQLHKGGPDTGLFLQLTADDTAELPVPDQGFTFGVLCRAQAQGDFRVLAARGRRILWVHLGADPAAGLARLGGAVAAALQGAP